MHAYANRERTTNAHRLLEVTPVSLLVVSRSLNSLFKVLFNFRLRYLFAIGLAVIFSLRRCIPPTSDCTLEQSYSQVWAFVRSRVDLQCAYGASTRYGQLLGNSFAHKLAREFELKHQTHTQHRLPCRDTVRLCVGLNPVRSPLLRVSLLFSFPPLNDMFKFSG